MSPIPKIIHQIWMGSNPEPFLWTDTVKDFARKHGWTYKLWTDDTIRPLLKEMDSIPGLKSIWDSFEHDMAGRADIVRYLFLYRDGGVYIDADSVILKPEQFATFLEKNTAAVFFAWENLSVKRSKIINLQGTRRLIATGVIGSVPKHPFFKEVLYGMSKNAEEIGGYRKGFAWKLAGPYYIYKVYAAMRKSEKGRDIHIYPMKYFYPRHWGGITDPELHKKVSVPRESMLFQYGYSTNGFKKIFARLARQTRRRSGVSGTRRQRSTR